MHVELIVSHSDEWAVYIDGEFVGYQWLTHDGQWHSDVPTS